MSEDNKNYIRKINAGHSDFLGYSQLTESDNFLGGYVTPPIHTAANIKQKNNTALETEEKKYLQLQAQQQAIHKKQQATQQELKKLEQLEQNIQERINNTKGVLAHIQQQEQELHTQLHASTQQIIQLTSTLGAGVSQQQSVFQTNSDTRSTPILINFQPENSTLQRLEMTHGVPAAFSQKQLAEFTTYYQDTGDLRRSWQNVFMRWVLRAWERESCNPKFLIDNNFKPSNEAQTLLEKNGIPASFYHHQIASFILHWRERGEKHNTWDSKFVNHVKMVWQREKQKGKLNEREQRRNQTLQERLTDDSWATEGVQFSEPDWGHYKG